MANAPDAIWDDASKNEADNSYRVNGTKDGVESYYASLTDDGKMLAIWTREDNEAGRTKPRLDTPSVSSVVGSNEKSTGEVTAGHVPSIDSELTPEINHPDVQANATSSSPAQRPASAHAVRTKVARDKLRSSCPAMRYFTSQTLMPKCDQPRSHIHMSGAAPPAAPTPLLMNAGTGLYNSVILNPLRIRKKPPLHKPRALCKRKVFCEVQRSRRSATLASRPLSRISIYSFEYWRKPVARRSSAKRSLAPTAPSPVSAHARSDSSWRHYCHLETRTPSTLLCGILQRPPFNHLPARIRTSGAGAKNLSYDVVPSLGKRERYESHTHRLKIIGPFVRGRFLQLHKHRSAKVECRKRA